MVLPESIIPEGYTIISNEELEELKKYEKLFIARNLDKYRNNLSDGTTPVYSYLNRDY